MKNLPVLLAFALLPTLSAAQVNRCVDTSGRVTFQQDTCATPATAESTSDRAKDIAARKAEQAANRKAVTADLEAQLEAQKKRLAERPPSPPIQTTRVSSASEPMTFDSCNRVVQRTVASLGALQARRITTSPLLTVTRICTGDGSVIITCSAPDASMVTTKSDAC